MKGKTTASFLVIVILSVLLSVSTSCKKTDLPKAVITVQDPNQEKLVNCQVLVFSNPNGSIIRAELTTNDAGQVMYEAENDCILNVKATYSQNNQNLSGYGLLILKSGETYYETITAN